MARYDYRCPSCGLSYEVTKKMIDASRQEFCPGCGAITKRIYQPVVDVWACEGSHRGDYGHGNTIGTKADRLNREWSHITGEEPPPPAADVPVNGRERY